MKNAVFRFRGEAVNGTISKQTFIDVMKEEFPSLKYEKLSLLYRAFDANNDGVLDCKEICVGLSVLHRGSAEERIQLAFKSCDSDLNGKLSPMELFHMFKSLAVSQGVRHSAKAVDKWVKQSFKKYDRGNKKYLVYEEFKMMVYRKPLMIQAFLEFNG